VEKEEITLIVERAIKKGFESNVVQPSCSLGIDKDAHDKQHQFLDSLISMSQKLDKIKWGFLGGVIKSVGMVIIGLICLGVVAWAKTELTKVGG